MGLLGFYDRGPLTPEERYQAALQARIAEAQGIFNSLNESMSKYPVYSDYADSPLTTYPIGIYRGLLGFINGENLNDMSSDADMLQNYILRESRQLNRQAPSMGNLTSPMDAQDVPALPRLRSR
jgi:hypothetical protein